MAPCLPLLAGLAEAFHALEREIVHWATCTIHSPFLDEVLSAAQSKTVAVPAMLAVLALVAWRFPKRTLRALVVAAAAWGIAMLVGTALWAIVDRPRPQRVYEQLLRTPEELATCAARPEALAMRTHGSKRPAFPSLHGMTIGVFVTTLFFLWWPVGAASCLWGALAALGRVYAGKHWPSDVLGGIVLGAVVAWLVWALLARLLARVAGGRWLDDPPRDAHPTSG